MKKQFKLLAVLSSAAVMTAVTPSIALAIPGFVQTAFAAGAAGWVTEDDALRYRDSDGYYLTDTWKKKDGDWYYLNEDGFVSHSTMVDEYYVDENGRRVFDQWIAVANEDEWDDEAPETYWYYYGKDGKSAVSKWQTIEEKNYYFNEEGHMQTGILELNDFTYYLGEEDDGVMKTGWIQLENESEDLDDEMVWHFFDNNGRMVKNQIDRKIDGSYYTFENGILQTGWYKLPASAAATDTATDTATDANAQETVSDTTDAPAIASYRYYEENGKRASGWYQIEGAPDISDEGEIYSFYFKNGSPYYAAAGIQVFTVDSKRYGFNTSGEMQTGLQTAILEDGTTASFYFGTDGVMKTGKQTIYDEDLGENQTWLFYTDGGNKGQGVHGIRDNSVYKNGLRLDADRDLRYAPADANGARYLVNTTGIIQKASSSSKSAANPELGSGYKDIKDTNDKIWTVDTNGMIQE
ncbi:MAG: cell wall-binding protein [Lachnospiraceae bacterium]|nr:cell wall-binding protein [Lachnospiraceae bacterium]